MLNRKLLSLALCSLAATCLPLQAQAQAQAQQMQIKMSGFLPPAHVLTSQLEAYAKELTSASAGKVAVKYYPAEALGKAAEQLDITIDGLADMAMTCAVYTPARYPLSMFVELPFFSGSAETSNKVVQALVAKKLLDTEYKQAKPLMFFTTAPSQVFSNKPLKKLDDFQGMRIIGMGPVWTQTWSLLGAQSVGLQWTDSYLALDRGTIDAVPGNWGSSKGWKWPEVAKYPVDVGIMGGFFCGILMNTKSWEKLPRDVQTRWTGVSEEFSMRLSKAYDVADEDGKKAWVAANRTIYVMPTAERERIAAKLLPIWQEWIKKNEAAGKPAREIYETYVDVMKKAGEPVVMKVPGLYK